MFGDSTDSYVDDIPEIWRFQFGDSLVPPGPRTRSSPLWDFQNPTVESLSGERATSQRYTYNQCTKRRKLFHKIDLIRQNKRPKDRKLPRKTLSTRKSSLFLLERRREAIDMRRLTTFIMPRGTRNPTSILELINENKKANRDIKTS